MEADLQAPVTQAPSTVTWRPAVGERAATPKVAAKSSASGERRSTSLRCSGVSTSTVAGAVATTCAMRTAP